MTEREKMLAGELYQAGDPELVEMRRRARQLTRLYHATTEDDGLERARLLRELLGTAGVIAEIEPPFRCDYGVNIRVGERFYANFQCIVLDCALVTIGDDVKFGPAAQIYTAHHPLDAAARCAGPELASPVTIGNRVWIGGAPSSAPASRSATTRRSGRAA